MHHFTNNTNNLFFCSLLVSPALPHRRHFLLSFLAMSTLLMRFQSWLISSNELGYSVVPTTFVTCQHLSTFGGAILGSAFLLGPSFSTSSFPSSRGEIGRGAKRRATAGAKRRATAGAKRQHKSIITISYTTNNLQLVASPLASPIIPSPFAILFAHLSFEALIFKISRNVLGGFVTISVSLGHLNLVLTSSGKSTFSPLTVAFTCVLVSFVAMGSQAWRES